MQPYMIIDGKMHLFLIIYHTMQYKDKIARLTKDKLPIHGVDLMNNTSKACEMGREVIFPVAIILSFCPFVISVYIYLSIGMKGAKLNCLETRRPKTSVQRRDVIYYPL